MQFNVTQLTTQVQQTVTASQLMSQALAFILTPTGLIILGASLLVISAVSHFLGKGLIIFGIILVVLGLASNAGLVL